jgi:hypothetical protein
MTTLDLARTQFGVTTLFHFIFVPMSIGMAVFVATCQTLHYRTGKEVYLRMTRFWGKFLLISSSRTRPSLSIASTGSLCSSKNGLSTSAQRYSGSHRFAKRTPPSAICGLGRMRTHLSNVTINR